MSCSTDSIQNCSCNALNCTQAASARPNRYDRTIGGIMGEITDKKEVEKSRKVAWGPEARNLPY